LVGSVWLGTGDRILVRLGDQPGLVDKSEVAVVAAVHHGGSVGVGIGEEEEIVAEELHLQRGFLGGQMPVDRGQVQTRADRGPVDLEEPRMVLREDGNVVPGSQTTAGEQVCESCRTLLELPVGDRRARAHDDRGLARVLDGVQTWMHTRWTPRTA
jgi:hypothetical protein